jgi:hypothetical protein
MVDITSDDDPELVVELEKHCCGNFLGMCLNFSYEYFYFKVMHVAMLVFPYLSRRNCVGLVDFCFSFITFKTRCLNPR